MHISLIILTPILICLWIYFLIIVTENIFTYSPKSLQLNIINKNSVIEHTSSDENVWSENKTKTDAVGNRSKKNFHVPKFMLELYEKNRKHGKNLRKSDVVKSLIPTHAGECRRLCIQCFPKVADKVNKNEMRFLSKRSWKLLEFSN